MDQASNTISTLYTVLFACTAFTFVLSFFFMIKTRGFLSALFWTFIPFRLLLSWGSDTEFDDNPPWLDRLQLGLIGTLALLWLWQRAQS